MNEEAKLVKASEIARTVYPESDAVKVLADFVDNVLNQPIRVYMWQHDETGRTGFVDKWQLENGWGFQNPRLRIVGRMYTL